ncbi:hypothetical protein DPMN_164202 [Dreissena polymorpha]|uniref:Uncharacterized protein n=1 Tax=Dreissena polymorpha TaxID=45954 RepID=A0A9D4EXA7_DREPO|nr:hypothetical protein DPMN_164202 [Dreissena polymorpha]
MTLLIGCVLAKRFSGIVWQIARDICNWLKYDFRSHASFEDFGGLTDASTGRVTSRPNTILLGVTPVLLCTEEREAMVGCGR